MSVFVVSNLAAIALENNAIISMLPSCISKSSKICLGLMSGLCLTFGPNYDALGRNVIEPSSQEQLA